MAISDFIAGVTVGLMVIPQGIAYALIANLPAQVSYWLCCFLRVCSLMTSRSLRGMITKRFILRNSVELSFTSRSTNFKAYNFLNVLKSNTLPNCYIELRLEIRKLYLLLYFDFSVRSLFSFYGWLRVLLVWQLEAHHCGSNRDSGITVDKIWHHWTRLVFQSWRWKLLKV